jgi:hypothetical protein
MSSRSRILQQEQNRRMEAVMRCRLCRNLEQAVEARRSEFLQASSHAYYGENNKYAAYMNVELERALSELQDHRSVCRAALSELECLNNVAQLRLPPQKASGKVERVA